MIETNRLCLRPFEPADLEAYAVIRSRQSNARYLPGGEAGAKAAAGKVRTLWGHDAWTEGACAPWTAVEKSSSRLIGHLGLRYLPEIEETELLYMIDEPWWAVASQPREAARQWISPAIDCLCADWSPSPCGRTAHRSP